MQMELQKNYQEYKAQRLKTSQEENVGTLDYEAGSSSHPKRHRDTETMEEAMLGRVYHQNLLWGGCNMKAKKRCNIVLVCLLLKQVYAPCVVDWTVLNAMGCAETIEEKLEIKFDEEVADEEWTTKKIIKFRLGGRKHFLSLLEFAHRLGLYSSVEIREEVDEEERSLDATTPRELIGPDGRLIVKDPALGVPRQSYHSDRCASVFEYMVGHYRVSLDRYYAPLEYDEQ
ncbi:hypothetical protein Tco_0332734 [Tanacetum coccineum]